MDLRELPLGAIDPPEEGPSVVSQPLKATSNAAQTAKRK